MKKQKIKFIITGLLAFVIGFFTFDAYFGKKEKVLATNYFLLEEDGTITKGKNSSLDFAKITWQDCNHPGVQIPLLYGKPILSKINDNNGAMYEYHPYLEDKTDKEWNISTVFLPELNQFLFEGSKYPNLTSDEAKDYQLVIKLKRELGGCDIYARLLVEGSESLPEDYLDAPFNLNKLVMVQPKKILNEDVFITVEW